MDCTKYYQDLSGNVICQDCAYEWANEDCCECTNDTRIPIPCSICHDDIAYVGQVYQGRADWHKLQRSL